ncbi:MAG: AzlC family ABC transporter permease [Beijerinckiaceae bacterium]
MSVALFTMAGVRRGVRAAQAMAPAIAIYGAAFGLLAREAGFSPLEATLMSAFVYSGSAQMAAVSAMPSGQIPATSAMLAIVATILLLNARYTLYSAALRPWMGGLPVWQVYPTLGTLGDGGWVMSMKAHAEGEWDAGHVFGTCFIMFIPWVGGTLLGFLSSGLIPNPRLLGFDFMLVAFCASMGISMVKGRDDVLIGGVALAVAVAADRLAPGGWALVAAGLAGAAVAFARAEAR